MKHYIRVCRPRFEVAIIEVEAFYVGEAEFSGPSIAAKLTDEQWTLLPFDGNSYFPRVERCAPADELVMGCNNDAERDQAIAEFRNPLLETDLTGGWIGTLMHRSGRLARL